MSNLWGYLTVTGISILLGAALAFGVVWGYAPDLITETKTEVRWKDNPLPLSDVFGTRPDAMDVHPAPGDSGETGEACITTPSKLADEYNKLVQRDSAGQDTTIRPRLSVGTGGLERRFEAEINASQPLLDTPFLILPVVDGGPAVDVNYKRTKITTYEPVEGGARPLYYNHPTPEVVIEPSLGGMTTTRRFWLDGVVEVRLKDLLSRSEIGVIGGAEWEPFLNPREVFPKVGVRFYPFKIRI